METLGTMAMLDVTYNVIATGILILVGLYGYATKARWSGLAVVVAGVSLCVLAVLLAGSRFQILRFAAYGLLIHLPIVCLLAGGFAWPRSRSLAVFWLSIAAVGFAIATDAFLIEPRWLEVTRLTIASSKIQTPVKVAIVADLQTDSIGTYEQRVFNMIESERPTLVLLAGDYLQVNDENWPELSEQLCGMMGRLAEKIPAGLFAVQGNVDHPKWADIFLHSNVKRFRQTETVDVAGISITGLTMQDSFNTQVHVRAVDRFQIVLGHSPDFALGNVDADLLVAGHTHGGQVCIPLVGPVITFSRVPRNWANAITKLDSDKTLIVSRGIGMERGHAPRIRFFCRPQLIFVDLVPK